MHDLSSALSYHCHQIDELYNISHCSSRHWSGYGETTKSNSRVGQQEQQSKIN